MMYRIKCRTEGFPPLKPEASLIDGKVFDFMEGWVITEEDASYGNGLYIGEKAMIPYDKNWPIDAPTWIASGDLVSP